MSWPSKIARISASSVAHFGEPVTLAERAVLGIFDPRGEPADGLLGSEVGLLGRMSAQVNPTVLLLDADAAELAEGDSLTIREAEYTVTRMDPDGAGLTRVALMPSGVTDPNRLDRWR
jgi:hypothetical protein